MNNPIIRKCIIENDIEPTRLDKYLASRFSYYSREKWKSVIESGLVCVNNEIPKYRKIVKKNDEITYHVERMEEPEVNKDVDILYDDGDLIIVNKPPNLPVIPSGRYHKNTLHTIMTEKLNTKIRMLNRIDRETSGCVILARSHEMASEFSKIVKTNGIKKIYLTIVENAYDLEDLFIVEGNMVSSPSIYYRRYQTFSKYEGKYSKTIFKTIRRLKNNHAILMAKLCTGRTHQIRVHLKECGLFMVGDKIYGRYGPIIFDNFLKDKENSMFDTLFERQALHAYKLTFTHPFTNKIIKIKAPIPKDLKEYIKNLT